MITFSTLAILLPAAIMLHVTEEFLFPGGFAEWYAELRPPKTEGIRYGYLVWINTLMIGVCVLPLYLGENPRAISIWYCNTAIAGINACFHIYGVFVLKKYSPGVVTGVLFYLPLFIVGSWQLLSAESISLLKASVFVAIAIGYHVFSYIRQGR
ncbi:HXXEE domain-containing protein [Dyadobacter sp. NIV53]|uniref:HXXEE domain-containing protein n=1 Tax=Dyadobacter sp. NIV53 TaxID=2861765 RepID=UPI001C872696|nr:HXXEE domain-containing protein [Dyadobacter sp. NIV53]